MVAHQNTGYLDFDPRYFGFLSQCLKENLLHVSVIYQGLTAASALFLRHGEYLDYFLAASSPKFLPLYPNDFMIYEVACWARRQGLKWFHLGGGSKSLAFFKEGFSKDRIPYFLGKKVHDPEVYDALVRQRLLELKNAGEVDTNYFPAYRLGLE